MATIPASIGIVLAVAGKVIATSGVIEARLAPDFGGKAEAEEAGQRGGYGMGGSE